MKKTLLPVRGAGYEGPPELLLRFRSVKLFLCDVDGILTDGGVYMGLEGELKRFDIRDGFGLKLMQQQGIKVGWVSHRPSEATRKRSEDLGIDFLHQARGSKVAAIEPLLTREGVSWDDVCFMGDDIVDLGALRRARISATVPEALKEVRMEAQYITHNLAGRGAVREVAELILRAQNLWQPLLDVHSA
jgi:3-deoxy-D-manno-octulosonate 8-phosphate phosphatase (KDO 8-P phosphatase)